MKFSAYIRERNENIITVNRIGNDSYIYIINKKFKLKLFNRYKITNKFKTEIYKTCIDILSKTIYKPEILGKYRQKIKPKRILPTVFDIN